MEQGRQLAPECQCLAGEEGLNESVIAQREIMRALVINGIMGGQTKRKAADSDATSLLRLRAKAESKRVRNGGRPHDSFA